MVFRSASAEETKAIAAKCAAQVARLPKTNRARILSLEGELGAGKTTFTQGFAKALGVRGRISSPTFVIMKRHIVKRGKYTNLYHIDAYRMHSMKDMEVLGIEAILNNPKNLVLIEWAANIKSPHLRGMWTIRFAHGKNPSARTIRTRKIT